MIPKISCCIAISAPNYDVRKQVHAQFGRTDHIRALIEHGADVNTENGLPIQLAAENCHCETVALLASAGSNVHAEDEAALRLAAARGGTNTVRVLIENGADLHVREGEALKNAVRDGKTETAALLLKSGAIIDMLEFDLLRQVAIAGHHKTLNLVLSSLSGNRLAQLLGVDEGPPFMRILHRFLSNELVARRAMGGAALRVRSDTVNSTRIQTLRIGHPTRRSLALI